MNAAIAPSEWSLDQLIEELGEVQEASVSAMISAAAEFNVTREDEASTSAEIAHTEATIAEAIRRLKSLC